MKRIVRLGWLPHALRAKFECITLDLHAGFLFSVHLLRSCELDCLFSCIQSPCCAKSGDACMGVGFQCIASVEHQSSLPVVFECSLMVFSGSPMKGLRTDECWRGFLLGHTRAYLEHRPCSVRWRTYPINAARYIGLCHSSKSASTVPPCWTRGLSPAYPLGFFLADVFEMVVTALDGGIRWRWI